MKSYPVLPLRNTVLFPNQIIPIYIGRKQSLKLIDDVSKSDEKQIIVVAQKDGNIENPKASDFYEYGTLANVMKVFGMPDNSKSAIVKGIRRIKIDKYTKSSPYFTGTCIDVEDKITDTVEIDVLCENLKTIFSNLIDIAPYLSEEQSNLLVNIKDPSRLADKAVSVMNIQTAEKQNILEEFDIKEKVQKALVMINKEVQKLELGDKIQSDVQDEISKSQKE